jgi:branched-chain amino acid transport system substrate-binding protein
MANVRVLGDLIRADFDAFGHFRKGNRFCRPNAQVLSRNGEAMAYSRLLLVVLCAAMLFARATPANGAGPYEIFAILSTTGSAAFLGTQEARVLQVVEKVVNRTGGIGGTPVHFTILDDASNATQAIQLLNGAIAQHASVIIGASVTATCSAMAPLVERSGPVEYCLSPGVHPVPGGYVFSSSNGATDIAVSTIRFFRERGWKRIAIMTTTDATGAVTAKALDAAASLPENKDVTIVAREVFNQTDLSVNAQVARIKEAHPQALVAYTTGTALGTVFHALQDTSLNIPISTSAGNMIYSQMLQYKGLAPEQLYFTATRGIALDPNLRPGPIKTAQLTYFAALREAGLTPDFASVLTWDPAMIIVDALRHVGKDATAEKLHSYIEQLHSWPGVCAIYDFRDNGQRGLGQNAMLVYRWDPAHSAFVVPGASGGL